MKDEREYLREYFDTVQPDEGLVERISALEKENLKPSRTPQKRWRVWAGAAAACVLFGFLGWRVFDLRQGNPNLVLPTETTAPTEPTEPTERPSASHNTTPPTETTSSASEPTETQPAEPPETAAPAVNTAPQPTAPTQPTNPSGEDVEPPYTPAWPPATEPTSPPATEPTEPNEPIESSLSATNNPSLPPSDGSTGEDVSFYGWLERNGGQDKVVVQNSDTGETLYFDVTGRLHGEPFQMEVTAFGCSLLIELDPLPPPDGEEPAEENIDYSVTITIL